PYKLAEAQARGVEELHDGAVAPPERGRRVRESDKARHFRFGQVGREALFALRRADERGGIPLDGPFAPEVPAERPDRRKLARRRGPRVAALVQVAKERADVKVIEIGGQQLGPASIEMGRDEGDKLREVALVRAHRV